MIPWNKNKLACFTNKKGSFQYSIWFMISEKSITCDSSKNTILHLGGAAMYQKVSAMKAYKKNSTTQFSILPTLKNYL